jgi:hypothetical protein
MGIAKHEQCGMHAIRGFCIKIDPKGSENLLQQLIRL